MHRVRHHGPVSVHGQHVVPELRLLRELLLQKVRPGVSASVSVRVSVRSRSRLRLRLSVSVSRLLPYPPTYLPTSDAKCEPALPRPARLSEGTRVNVKSEELAEVRQKPRAGW